MSNLLKKVVVEASTKKKGEPFLDEERAITLTTVAACIEELGGVPTDENGKVALRVFIAPVRTACLEAGAVPEVYVDKGRSWGAYAFLADQAVKILVAKAKKEAAVAAKAQAAQDKVA